MRTTVVVMMVLVFSIPCMYAQEVMSMKDFSKFNAEIMRVTSPKSIDAAEIFTHAFPAITKVPQTMEEFRQTKSAILSELVNHEVYVRAYSMEADGTLSYLTGSVAGKGKKIVVQQDYINYKLVETAGVTQKVGIVLRIEAELITKESKVDLNGLFAIGLAVKSGSAAGQLKVRVYGLAGEPVSSLLPLPSEISEGSLQTAMQAVASLKAKIYDDKVTIAPQIIVD